ncbi:MAG: molybdopterin-binding protein [Peptococcaceae bacterium]|jgi:molybdenum cofactor synthesis domain-containing protein|nr:molybdopterin-binding protein [Peptococcaceae bacterium]MDH7524601.1 molybdopterin-binding protein [Peptococcaceae bacterium]
MRKVRIEEAVGMVLAHDVTRIVPGEFKGPAFRKGHVIRAEDIGAFLDLGKEHVYAWEARPGWLHEDEAAAAIARAVAGEGLRFTEPKEGKITFLAGCAGLIKVDVERLELINTIDQVVLSTLHNNRPAKEGEKVAATRVVPLVIEEGRVREVERIAKSGPIIFLKPLKPARVGIVTTGNEVYKGRIKDGFGPALQKKMLHYGCEITGQEIVPDEPALIKQAIMGMRNRGAEIILVTGGMSVDPDDVTPLSIRELGAELVTYGSPVLPGAMFLLSYWNGIPVLGLPGCVMYASQTVFDLVFPRLLAGEKLSKRDIARLGHGGLCLDCEDCRYPACSFGKA